jgi:hypothetical protein
MIGTCGILLYDLITSVTVNFLGKKALITTVTMQPAVSRFSGLANVVFCYGEISLPVLITALSVLTTADVEV